MPMNKQLVIYVDDKTRKRLKLAAVRCDSNVSSIVNEAITLWLSQRTSKKGEKR